MLAPPFPLWDTEKQLAPQADRSRSTTSTCAGWCNVINPSFWNRENTTVTAREVWGVCLPLSRAHLPYRVPYNPQKPAMTVCSRDTHPPLSHIPNLQMPVISLGPRFIHNLLCLGCSLVLPRTLPICGNTLHTVRRPLQRTERGKQRNKSSGSRKLLWSRKGKILLLSER